MYTTFNKSLIAAIMGVVSLGALFIHGIDLNQVSGVLAVIVPIVTPVLVHFIPNLPQD